jgi:hypothetical protein
MLFHSSTQKEMNKVLTSNLAMAAGYFGLAYVANLASGFVTTKIGQLWSDRLEKHNDRHRFGSTDESGVKTLTMSTAVALSFATSSAIALKGAIVLFHD